MVEACFASGASGRLRVTGKQRHDFCVAPFGANLVWQAAARPQASQHENSLRAASCLGASRELRGFASARRHQGAYALPLKGAHALSGQVWPDGPYAPSGSLVARPCTFQQRCDGLLPQPVRLPFQHCQAPSDFVDLLGVQRRLLSTRSEQLLLDLMQVFPSLLPERKGQGDRVKVSDHRLGVRMPTREIVEECRWERTGSSIVE